MSLKPIILIAYKGAAYYSPFLSVETAQENIEERTKPESNVTRNSLILSGQVPASYYEVRPYALAIKLIQRDCSDKSILEHSFSTKPKKTRAIIHSVKIHSRGKEEMYLHKFFKEFERIQSTLETNGQDQK